MRSYYYALVLYIRISLLSTSFASLSRAAGTRTRTKSSQRTRASHYTTARKNYLEKEMAVASAQVPSHIRQYKEFLAIIQAKI